MKIKEVFLTTLLSFLVGYLIITFVVLLSKIFTQLIAIYFLSIVIFFVFICLLKINKSSNKNE